MARAKKKARQDFVQPEDLPRISVYELPYKNGGFKINPFEYRGQTYRIVGTTLIYVEDVQQATYSIKCVETGEYKEKPEQWLKAITTKKKK